MIDALMEWVWPWTLYLSLLLLELGVVLMARRIGAARVDQWVFAHRDHLPIPFLLIGLLTRLFSHDAGPASWWHGGREALGVGLIMLGESLRMWAVGIVGASTRSASTNAKRLVQEGPYAIIRNPIYAGNLLLCLGLACFTASWDAAFACLIYFVIVYGRIIRAEERFLSAAFPGAYDDYCRRVPRLIPSRGWPRHACRAQCSVREWRKEYQTIVGILFAALCLHLALLRPWLKWPERHGAAASISRVARAPSR